MREVQQRGRLPKGTGECPKAGKIPRKRKPAGVGSEKCLQLKAQQWLEKSGIWARLLIFHVPNERKGGIGAILHFKRMGVRPGVADYLAFPGGPVATAIELKDADGEQSKDQERFQRQWEVAGNTYVVVRTLEAFQSVVQALTLFA